jgi:hypothetical protein
MTGADTGTTSNAVQEATRKAEKDAEREATAERVRQKVENDDKEQAALAKQLADEEGVKKEKEEKGWQRRKREAEERKAQAVAEEAAKAADAARPRKRVVSVFQQMESKKEETACPKRASLGGSAKDAQGRRVTAKEKGGFELVASGSGGFGEIQEALDDSMLCYGMMRFTVGKGTFARTKMILLHFIGETCGAMVRGRGNARKGDAVKELAPTHVDLVFNGKEEFEEDLVLER